MDDSVDRGPECGEHQVAGSLDVGLVGVGSGASAEVVAGGDVEERVDACHCIGERRRVGEVSVNDLDRQSIEASLVAASADHCSDFGAGVERGADDMSADEPVGSCDQSSLQGDSVIGATRRSRPRARG